MTSAVPSAREPLRRDGGHRMIAGVAAGIAAHAGLDRRIVRAGFLALGLAAGAGLILYLIAWVVIPGEGGAPSVPGMGSQPVELVAVAALAIGGFGILRGAGGVIPAAIFLIALGLGALWWRQAISDPTTPSEPARSAALPYPGPPSRPIAPKPAIPPLASPGRRGPRVTLATLCALLAAFGIAWLLDGAGALEASTAGMLALSLTIVGAGLIAGAWLGRGGPLIPIGVLIAVVLAPLAVGIPSLSGGTGERDWRPTTRAEAMAGFELGAGQARLDLTSPTLPPGPTRISASVGFGHLIVTLPRDARVEVVAEAGAGDLFVLERAPASGTRDRQREDSGLGAELRATLGPATAPTRLILDLEVGFGAIEIRPT